MSKITRTMLEGLIARVYYINGREATADFVAATTTRSRPQIAALA